MTEILFLRLPAMARAINLKVEGYTAVVEKTSTNTDRKVGRYRIPGKGREGNRLIVTNADGVKMFEHDASRGGKNDGVAFTIEKLWGPVWDKDCQGQVPPLRQLQDERGRDYPRPVHLQRLHLQGVVPQLQRQVRGGNPVDVFRHRQTTLVGLHQRGAVHLLELDATPSA